MSYKDIRSIIVNKRVSVNKKYGTILNCPYEKQSIVQSIFWYSRNNRIGIEPISLKEAWRYVKQYYAEFDKKTEANYPTAQEMVNAAMRDNNYYKTARPGIYFGD
jgi:hypothetical protein